MHSSAYSLLHHAQNNSFFEPHHIEKDAATNVCSQYDIIYCFKIPHISRINKFKYFIKRRKERIKIQRRRGVDGEGQVNLFCNETQVTIGKGGNCVPMMERKMVMKRYFG